MDARMIKSRQIGNRKLVVYRKDYGFYLQTIGSVLIRETDKRAPYEWRELYSFALTNDDLTKALHELTVICRRRGIVR